MEDRHNHPKLANATAYGLHNPHLHHGYTLLDDRGQHSHQASRRAQRESHHKARGHPQPVCVLLSSTSFSMLLSPSPLLSGPETDAARHTYTPTGQDSSQVRLAFLPRPDTPTNKAEAREREQHINCPVNGYTDPDTTHESKRSTIPQLSNHGFPHRPAFNRRSHQRITPCTPTPPPTHPPPPSPLQLPTALGARIQASYKCHGGTPRSNPRRDESNPQDPSPAHYWHGSIRPARRPRQEIRRHHHRGNPFDSAASMSSWDQRVPLGSRRTRPSGQLHRRRTRERRAYRHGPFLDHRRCSTWQPDRCDLAC